MTPYDLPDYHAMIRHIRDVDRAGGDSTLARKVVADWLEEHGEEERAACVREQCQQPPHEWSMSTLIDGHGPLPHPMRYSRVGDAGWVHTAVDGDHASLPWLQFAHGFIARVECPLAWWLTHGPDICRRHPVREVAIAGVSPAPYYGGQVEPMCWFWHDHGDQRSNVGKFGVQPIEHRTEAEAVAWLSAQVLRWAEAEADRPGPFEVPA